jgi:hypothetical protein
MTWIIEGQLLTEDIGSVTGFVKEVRWAYQYENDGVVGEINDTIDFEYDPNTPFIPFADLTQEQVVQWVKDALGSDAVSFYEDKVAEVVDAAVASEDPNPRKMFITAFYVGSEQNQDQPWA